MARPTIKLLQRKPLEPYRCDMCGEATRRNRFSWESWFTKEKIMICRDCAYKERFGSKKVNKAKKEGLLEEKSTN